MKRLLFIVIFNIGMIEIALGIGQLSKAKNDTVTSPINLTKVGFKKSMLATSVGKMAVFEAGKGEPLLLLHGVGAGASSFLWYTIAPKLAEHYRVIAPDFVGWGESFRPERPVLFDDYVQQIKELGAWIGEPTKIVTQSLTCGFVIAAMREDGISVSKLVMNAPSGGLDFGVDASSPEATKYFSDIAASPKRDEIYAKLFHRKAAVEDWYRRIGFLASEAVPTDLIEAGHYNAKQPNASYSALPFLSGKLRYDIAPLLKEVTIPSKMIWGEDEFQIPPKVWQRIEKVNSKIEAARIKNARSTFEIERPEATMDEILPFLKGTN